jgi:hypothetical protein
VILLIASIPLNSVKFIHMYSYKYANCCAIFVATFNRYSTFNRYYRISPWPVLTFHFLLLYLTGITDSRFCDFVDRIYPIELEIKDTTDTDRSASYLDLHLEIDSEGRLRTKLYDKRDDFNFPIALYLYMYIFLPKYIKYFSILPESSFIKKSMEIPKGQSESVYRTRTDNTMAKRTRGSVGWACVAYLSFCFEET